MKSFAIPQYLNPLTGKSYGIYKNVYSDTLRKRIGVFILEEPCSKNNQGYWYLPPPCIRHMPICVCPHPYSYICLIQSADACSQFRHMTYTRCGIYLILSCRSGLPGSCLSFPQGERHAARHIAARFRGGNDMAPLL